MKKNSLHKMYVILCSVVLLAVLLSFLTQILIIRKTLVANTEQNIRDAHQQSYNNIGNYFSNIENVAYTLGYNTSMRRFFEEIDDVERLKLFSDLHTVFAAFSTSQPDMTGYAIYDSEGRFITANASIYQAIIQVDMLSEQNTVITYSSIYPPNPYIGITAPYYVMSVPIIDFSSSSIQVQRIGTVVFTMNQSYITAQVESSIFTHGYAMVLLDENDNVIAGKADDDSSILVIENIFPSNGWKLATYLKTGFIADNMQPLILLTFVISLTVVILIVIFIILLSARLLKPINSISMFMRNLTGEKIDTRVYQLQEKYSYTELVSMANAMNHMIQSLDRKTDELLNKEKENYEVTLEKNRMEILAYRSQINPHFLYNTFECISGIAMSRDVPEIVEITAALSQMFKYAVKGDDFVTVAEELTHIEYYTVIINYRFMGRIRIQVDASQDVMAYRIPRLVLQPLVENAVLHGLEQKIGNGSIKTFIGVENGNLHMKVSDDGVGMDGPALKQLNESLLSPLHDKNGIGISNIMHRLKIYYSGKAEIKMESIQGKGSVFELILPVEVCKNV